MENRITRDSLYMSTALLFARRAMCVRGKVGCVLVKDNRIIATSYNGPLPGHKHCGIHCDIDHPCSESIHAEQNLIAYCARHGIQTEETHLYITTAPCKTCAKVLIQAGINKVIYYGDFREQEGIQLLTYNSIKVEKYEETRNGPICLGVL
jgi:dCMP deaminase